MANISAIKLPDNETYNIKDNGALQLTGGQVTGPVTFGDSVSIDEATIGDLVINGNASFTNNIQANTINGVTVGSSPKFTDTDTKVTSSANHYTPATASGNDKTASASGATAAWSIDVVKGITINTDGKGHITGLSVTSGKIPANPNTDVKVKQLAAITTAGAYPIILAYSTATTEETNSVNKTSTLTYNPNTKALVTGGTVDGYTLAAASAKSVVTSIDTSASLPTSNAVKTFVENKGYTTNTGTVTQVTAGTGLSIGTTAGGNFTTSGTINHTNSVTAQTTQAIYPIKIDAQGHISAYGTSPTTLSGYGITDAKIASGTITLGSNTITPLTSSSTLSAAKLSGAIPSAVTATTQASTDNSTKIATTAYVTTAIANLPEPMIFKGSVGTGGTVTSLPTAAASNEGWTYKVITALSSPAAKVGDTVISNGSEWVVIPSGDEPSGTVTSVGVSNATNGGLTVSGSPITSSGTITIGHSNVLTSAQTTQAVYPIKIDKNGHISAYGSAVTIPTVPSNIVNTITTTAGTHTTITSQKGNVSFNVPTKTSHLTNDSGFITSYTDTKVTNTAVDATTANTTYYLVGSENFNTETDTLVKSDARVQILTTQNCINLHLGNNTNQGRLLLHSHGNTLALVPYNIYDEDHTYWLPDATGTIALTSDIPTIPSDIVNTITTTAGAHTAITSQKGNVSFNVPTTAAHVGIKFGYTTSGNNRAVLQDSSGNLYVTQKDDNTNTTYALSGALSSHKFTSTLTAGGSGSGTSTSDFTLAAGTGITITDDASARKMTIACSVTNTDEKVKAAALTSGTLYYPILATGTGTATRQIDSTLNGLTYKSTAGTASIIGTAKLTIGNSIASGRPDNEQGQIILYGSTAYAHTIVGEPTIDRTITLPNASGTLALNTVVTAGSSVSSGGLMSQADKTRLDGLNGSIFVSNTAPTGSADCLWIDTANSNVAKFWNNSTSSWQFVSAVWG